MSAVPLAPPLPPVPVFRSRCRKDEVYQSNYAKMLELVDELNGRLAEAQSEGPANHVRRHLESGQMLTRERVELLLDVDSPFLELMPLAGWGQEGVVAGGSIVGGIGLICGLEVLITANIPTIKGGAVNEVSVKKGGRLAEIALINRLPSVTLVQSAGADLSQQDRVFHMGGAGFRELARRSKAGLPTISVVFGSSTAGGAYTPAMSDYVVMVKKQAKVFLGGPPLVKMATGEVVDDESLGGAEMHSKISGVSDYLAVNEIDALARVREIVAHLNFEKRARLPPAHFSALIEEPVYASDEILGIASADIRLPYDAREVIARIVDGSRMAEFKPLYGSTLVTCFAHIHGVPIGIVANNGVLFSEAANKGTQFIHLCNQKNVPLLFLHNITGFMVGKKYEQGGIIKHGAHMINAVSNSGVPAISIVIGSSYGAGNYAMCGRSYKPRFLFSWPNSRCSVMGPDQLTGVMDIVMRDAAAKAGRAINEEQAAVRKEMLRTVVQEQMNVYYTSSRLIDDGIIDPRDTRTVVGFCLSAVYNEEVRGENLHGVSRM